MSLAIAHKSAFFREFVYSESCLCVNSQNVKSGSLVCSAVYVSIPMLTLENTSQNVPNSWMVIWMHRRDTWRIWSGQSRNQGRHMICFSGLLCLWGTSDSVRPPSTAKPFPTGLQSGSAIPHLTLTQIWTTSRARVTASHSHWHFLICNLTQSLWVVIQFRESLSTRPQRSWRWLEALGKAVSHFLT